ncbi:MAG: hypothetical protein A2498_09100 [Lentisphaerae bacterium RIFOXYC12_FULL_60_16]|nr:MAG: hypothetical protein A2498_09100 [Lentisphaerae bacterium RIFOXYC12_FULL_60_16]OGV86972.1 MAG: hypothetical protein A2340_14830 [Lentisphaerae bacterium RIFOXYB12_FULL_60_10]
MKVETCNISRHETFQGPYRRLILDASGIGCAGVPGQFVHLRIPRLDGAVLRRPFSLYRAGKDGIEVLYKPVGRGTDAMLSMVQGDSLSLIGPLGNGFPVCGKKRTPVLVAGGYGVAPLSFLALTSARPGIIFIGGARADDVLCVDDFKSRGWDVRVTTEDGSLGAKGRVTVAIDAWLQSPESRGDREWYACGPDGLLKAVGERAAANGWNAWLSLDKHMGCGVGACLACVQRVRNADGTEGWVRVCRDGPVFEARSIVW